MSWSRAIVNFQDRHQNERAFVLGNGPSLKGIDIDELKQHGTVFGTNRVYLSGYEPDYYVAVNPLILQQFEEEIMEQKSVEAFFLPKEFEKYTQYKDKSGIRYTHQGNVYGLDTSVRTPYFAQYAGEPLYEGHTVTYVCLQLAYQMGFVEVVVLGLDHDYGEENTSRGEENKETTSKGSDPYHFHPEYFGKGVKWNKPDLPMSEMAYAIARDQYERDGRRIINASARTKCSVFELQPLKHVLDPNKTRVSAIVSAYKAQPYLLQCLDDLYNQSETSMEIVAICQEGSREENTLRSYEPPNAKALRMVLTDDVPTVYNAWNLGIAEASGSLLTNANADDRHHRDAYRTMANILYGNPRVDLVYHDSFVTWEEASFDGFVEKWSGKNISVGREHGQPGILAWPHYSRYALHNGCFIGPHPMWRANLHQLHGGFHSTMESAGDYEFWLRASGHNNFFHLSVPMGLYMARTDGIELSDLERSMQESHEALHLHQGHPSEMRPYGANLIKLSIGDDFVFVVRDELKKDIGRL